MKINGSDLMVFIKVGGTFKSIAYAKTHTLDVTLNTIDTSTKDNGNGRWQDNEPGLASWTMSSENLIGDDGENGATIDDLFEIMLKREKVEVAFSLQSNMPDYASKLDKEFVVPEGGWTPDTANQYAGSALITSLNATGANGEKASASVTFTGCGNLRKLGKGLGVKAAAASLSAVSEVKVETATATKSAAASSK